MSELSKVSILGVNFLAFIEINAPQNSSWFEERTRSPEFIQAEASFGVSAPQQMKKPITTLPPPEAGRIASILADLVGDIPNSPETASSQPQARARLIAKKAAMKAGAISGMLAAPPGPLGLATVIPDLIGIWRLQRQMVADIAGAYGKTAELSPATMVYCLFKHGGAALTRDLVVRAGERFLIRQTTVKSMQHILQRIGVNISQRVITKTLSRFIPLIGALGLGAYAYYDTSQVAATAIELFTADPVIDPGDKNAESSGENSSVK